MIEELRSHLQRSSVPHKFSVPSSAGEIDLLGMEAVQGGREREADRDALDPIAVGHDEPHAVTDLVLEARRDGRLTLARNPLSPGYSREGKLRYAGRQEHD